MLIMREASYGTTRFDDFARRVGITKAAASTRLSELVDAGLLTKRPYRDPGQRSRDEYVLTDAGTDFMPVVWAMFEWGRKHLNDTDAAPDAPGLRRRSRPSRSSAAKGITCHRTNSGYGS